MGKRFHPSPWQRSMSRITSGKAISVKNIMVCPHPPYSLDLALCDFWPFPKVKLTMKGKCFESIQDIEAATTAQLRTLMKEDLLNCFGKWQEWWDKCVQGGGEGILRGINGNNVSFTIIPFYLNIRCIFWSRLVYKNDAISAHHLNSYNCPQSCLLQVA